MTPETTILYGDAWQLASNLEPQSIDCIVTSPPYWGLRDYGHPDQFGLERTPQEYVAKLVDLFARLRPALKDEGTVWLNLGDSYASDPGKGGSGTPNGRNGRGENYGRAYRAGAGRADGIVDERGQRNRDGVPATHGLKAKDLVGIPWRVAFALQEPRYLGRIACEKDRAWLAAMIDGEGTICGFRHERADGNIRTGTLVFITNSDTRLLDEADRIWPGARYIDTLKEGDEVMGTVCRHDCWRWQIQKAEERDAILRELWPYLVAKKQQAVVAWNLNNFALMAKKMGRGGETEDIKVKRELLVRLLSDLNQRRGADIPSWVKEPPLLYGPGWYLRSDVIWAKNNPMPESVTDRPTKAHEYLFLLAKSERYYFDQEAVAEPITLSSVARLGQPTIQEQTGSFRVPGKTNGPMKAVPPRYGGDKQSGGATYSGREYDGCGGKRNIRTVWTIPTHPYAEAHFATFPPKLIEPCIKAGTSERGVCPECGKPWERMTARVDQGWDGSRYGEKAVAASGGVLDGGTAKSTLGSSHGQQTGKTRTLYWMPTCDCRHGDENEFAYAPIPATVLDPFLGSGTTAEVARKLGRNCVGFELNEDYRPLIDKRLAQGVLL